MTKAIDILARLDKAAPTERFNPSALTAQESRGYFVTHDDMALVKKYLRELAANQIKERRQAMDTTMLTDEQRDDLLANRPAETVTRYQIEEKVREVDYVTKGSHTICYITLQNGFTITGQSCCAHPENYNEELGRKIAYDNAFREIWPLEGYLLRERLYQAGMLEEGSGEEESVDDRKKEAV